MSNPFILPVSNYKRSIDPLVHYVDQTASYLMLSTGKTFDACKEFVKRKLKDGTFQIRDPRIQFLERADNGDRAIEKSTLTNYIYKNLKAGNIIAPSFTTYIHPSVKESILVGFIDDNVAGRAKAKKEEFAAKAAGDLLKTKYKNLEQTGRKLSNNAISGAHVSQSTPLANKTAHSSLTSNCRSTSGYGNANNEKLMTGNRHYWNPNVTINNIVSIVTHTDYDKLKALIDKYSLHYPTVEDAMSCILYSTDMYWKNVKAEKKIFDLIFNLTPIQRAAFVYTGDLYHLRKHNEEFLRGFIGRLSLKVMENPTIEDPFSFIKAAREVNIDLAHQICSDEMKGKGKDYNKLKGTNNLVVLAATTNNIDKTLTDYTDMIQAVMVTENMPASVSYFPESIRRAALTSDTDSTIFTVEEWVQWYCGSARFDQIHMSVAATCIFLASQAIGHILAMMSANFGIETKRLHQIAMKNEFKFDVFVPTNVAKHYFASISCQEGNVFEELESEIKGVHLKNSNTPKFITDKAAEMMFNIMSDIREKGTISIVKYLKEISTIEKGIFSSIERGERQFFRLGEIKNPDSYKLSVEKSPFIYDMLWTDVFAERYGPSPEAPYQVLRVATTIDNATLTKEWLENMKDKDLSKRMTDWLEKHDKKCLPSLLVPVELTTQNGIPKEILDIIDARKIVFNLCKIFYLVLETLGFYICNDKITRLVSDQY